jgi:hypothetical protein
LESPELSVYRVVTPEDIPDNTNHKILFFFLVRVRAVLDGEKVSFEIGFAGHVLRLQR